MSSTLDHDAQFPDRVDQNSLGTVDETDRPWRNELLLRYLYSNRGLSLREIADRFGCHHSTVGTWLDQYDIPTRDAIPPRETWFEASPRPIFWTTPKGYTYARSNHEGATEEVSIHALTAIAGGADPHRVFAENTHCHHELYKLDTPKTVVVLDASEHCRLHASGEFEEQSGRLFEDQN